MDGAVVSGRKRRIFRGIEEKLRIVKLALEPGASVASVALANGVNANQVFRWKRQYERGELEPRRSKSATALVPVTITAEPEAPKLLEPSIPPAALPCAGSITIEFPGRALLSIEGAADPGVIRAVLESLRR
jgi:transposase